MRCANGSNEPGVERARQLGPDRRSRSGPPVLRSGDGRAGRGSRPGRLVAHTLAETYAVLGSAAYNRAPTRIAEYLRQFLARSPVGVTPARYPQALSELRRASTTAPRGRIASATSRSGF